jgi:outer membrane protein assembly factor BamA
VSQIPSGYDLNQLTNDFVSLYVDARTNTFDDGYFPTRGVNAGVSYAWTFAGFPHKFNNFQALQADAKTDMTDILENMYGMLRTAKFINGEGDKDE